MTMRPDDHRRKWDRAEYERLAEERKREEREREDDEENRKKGPPVKRELLKPREYKVDLDSKLGKSIVINKNTPTSQSGGYYCNVCDCVVKDSINFLDHINGKKHQRNLGMSMRVERSSLDAVKGRFQSNKKKMEEKRKDYDMAQRMQEIAEEEEKLKEYRREKRKEKRKAEEMEEPNEQAGELTSIMGFTGFGSGKKK
ncbi:hypothetical protein PPYR_11308 [Photinus pyralis]|uniref:U1-type domain-containing protein n=1 Tax=Photinus pyralis TaxID=7054 RepID=A0A1Y1M551_PHOPY|nr:zinc finger matrin-type protein 2 [Photinus pyralis]KAB0794469.1 hypothetical protein PPYR_11308 [Photinus pyralis]